MHNALQQAYAYYFNVNMHLKNYPCEILITEWKLYLRQDQVVSFGPTRAEALSPAQRVTSSGWTFSYCLPENKAFQTSLA